MKEHRIAYGWVAVHFQNRNLPDNFWNWPDTGRFDYLERNVNKLGSTLNGRQLDQQISALAFKIVAAHRGALWAMMDLDIIQKGLNHYDTYLHVPSGHEIQILGLLPGRKGYIAKVVGVSKPEYMEVTGEELTFKED